MAEQHLRLTVGVMRAGELGANGCLCSIPRSRLGNGFAEGELVTVTSSSGASTLARLQTHASGDQALVDRALRLTLKLRVGEWITVTPAQPVRVEEVVFVPAADISRMLMEGVEASLKAALVEAQTPLSEGLVLHLRLPGASAGTFFKVTELVGGPGPADDETLLRVTYSTEAQFTEVSQGVSYADVGGLQEQLAAVRELVELPLLHPYLFRRVGINPPKGLIFHGPPGTGKTHVARAIASEVEARFYYINGADVAGKAMVEAETALRRTFSEAAHHTPSIIFIDEIDALAPVRGETGLHSDTKLVAQLLTLLDGLHRMDGVTVIATTNRVNTIDPALRRPGRFEREILFTLPSTADRLSILDIHSREMPLTTEASAYLPKLAESTAGYTGADLMELCREAALHAIRRAIGDENPRTIDSSRLEVAVEPSDFEAALRALGPSALREVVVDQSEVTWADVGGLEEPKRRLRELLAARLQHSDVLRALDLPSALGILLYGPPGTGKTLLAKAAAKEFGLHFISIRGPEVFSKWMGESEQAVRRIFTLARQVAPCVVFFDQLEAIAPRTLADTGASAPERVLHQLLSELDQLERDAGLVVIGAAQSPEAIHPSLLRSGRFGHHIALPLPSRSDRAEVLRIHLAVIGEHLDGDVESIVADLVDKTDGMSAADLRSVCDEAKYRAAARVTDAAMLRVSRADFEAAVSTASERYSSVST